MGDTQQRVYGTLIYDNCHIDLRRFACVFGSTTKSPRESANVLYGNEVPMTQTGYKYDGYITLFMYQDTGDIYAAIEVRICKRDKKTILIETYGEVAIPDYDIGLWFNKNNIKYFNSQYDFPQSGSETVTYIDLSTDTSYTWNGSSYTEGDGWIQLDSEIIGNTLAYNEQLISRFEEKGSKDSLTLINCCKNCPDVCRYLCNLDNYIIGVLEWLNAYEYGYEQIHLSFPRDEYPYSSVDYSTVYGVKISIDYGMRYNGHKTIYFHMHDFFVEYKVGITDIHFWIYTRHNTNQLMFLTLLFRQETSPYGYLTLYKGLLHDLYYNDQEVIINLTDLPHISSLPPTITPINYTSLIGKTIKMSSYLPVTNNYTYAKIIDITDNNIAIIDPTKILSSLPNISFGIYTMYDGDFEINDLVLSPKGFGHISESWYTSGTMVQSRNSFADLYRDITMIISIKRNDTNENCAILKWLAWTDQYNNAKLDYFNNVILNEDNTYTTTWSGPLTNESLMYGIDRKHEIIVCITTLYDPFLINTSITLSGNIQWYTSTGREIHYGDKGLFYAYEQEGEYFIDRRLEIHINDSL